MTIFSRNLRVLVADSGKSQKEIAYCISVSPQRFNTWVQDKAFPHYPELLQLASYFNIPLSNLFEDHSAAPSDDRLLLSHFHKLNTTGKDEAVKRVEELTEIEKYTKKESPAETAG